MENVKISDYLSSEEEKIEKLRDKNAARAKKFKKRTLIFAACFVVVIAGAAIISPIMERNAYDSYKNLEASDTEQIALIADDDEMISDSTLFEKYEESCLGNACNNSLNGGLIVDNYYGYSVLSDDGTVKIIAQKGSFELAEKNADCINLTEQKVYYRKSDDHKFYSCDYDGKNEQVVFDGECGQCIIDREQYVYFLNYENNSCLERINLSEGNKETVVDNAVKGFLILGDKFIYQDYFNTLYRCSIDGMLENTIDNVDKFYYNGDIVVQNNDKVVTYNLTEGTTTELAQGVDELLGADKKNIYVSQKGKANAISLKDGANTTLLSGYDFYYGAFSANKKTIILGGELDEN